MMIIRHDTIWAAPAPLWADQEPNSRNLSQPAVLRFASDSFMDDLNIILEADPSQLRGLRAIYETWRNPAPQLPLPESLDGLTRHLRQQRNLLPNAAIRKAEQAELERLTALAPEKLVKLYHPAHQRFYLVAGCLVCATPGMPDHLLRSNERAAFVVRRLYPTAKKPDPSDPYNWQDQVKTPDPPDPYNWQDQWQEYAFVTHGKAAEWQAVKSSAPVINEERLALFPLSYIAEDGRRRRIMAGLVPVSRRETYLGARCATKEPQPAATLDPRIALLQNDLIDPYSSALAMLAPVKVLQDNEGNAPDGTTSDQLAKPIKDIYDQIQVLSWYALLDFSSFLASYLPHLRQAIGATANAPFPPEMPKVLPAADPTRAKAEADLLKLLQDAKAGNPARTLADAIRDIEAYRGHLAKATQSYTTTDNKNPPKTDQWPQNFVFLLTDLANSGLFNTKKGELFTALEYAVMPALPDNQLRLPELPPSAQPIGDIGGPAYFLIRMLLECPACGVLRPPMLSSPTMVFEMASFFDPDAPARPIRIPLPIDSTPGGLRKYTKSVAVLLSDQLACQKDRMGGLTLGDLVLSVLPWPLHKDLPVDATDCGKGDNTGIGVICSLSIPIITICALLLLLIIVNLLDAIFHWVPYFIFCLPLPNFKGKK